MFYLYVLKKDRVGVKMKRVNLKKKTQIYQLLPEDICMIKAGTPMIELTNAKILTPEGEEIPPAGHFFRTALTFEPYHLVTDIF